VLAFVAFFNVRVRFMCAKLESEYFLIVSERINKVEMPPPPKA
jgi:hypothetical protein